MSLEFYIEKFKGLKVARRGEHASPHKVCMLLTVMDLIEQRVIIENRIEFNEQLIEKFEHHFKMMSTDIDQSTPHYPYYHLKNDNTLHQKASMLHKKFDFTLCYFNCCIYVLCGKNSSSDVVGTCDR